jgi:putative endonuclease
MKSYFIDMMSNFNNTVLYIGVTSDLIKRVFEHKNGINDGFTKQYKCNKLVWFDQTADIYEAIKKEKQMKKWKREYKDNIINEFNPEWNDLYYGLIK